MGAIGKNGGKERRAVAQVGSIHATASQQLLTAQFSYLLERKTDDSYVRNYLWKLDMFKTPLNCIGSFKTETEIVPHRIASLHTFGFSHTVESHQHVKEQQHSSAALVLVPGLSILYPLRFFVFVPYENHRAKT